MRKLNIPKSGFVFRHKKNTELFARELYLAAGENIEDYEQIPESEYKAIQEKEKEITADIVLPGI